MPELAVSNFIDMNTGAEQASGGFAWAMLGLAFWELMESEEK